MGAKSGRTRAEPLFALRVADRRIRTPVQIREFGTGALKHEGGGPNEGALLRTVDCFRTRPHSGLELVEGAPSIGLRLENGGRVLNAGAAGDGVRCGLVLRPASSFGLMVLLAALDTPVSNR